MATAALAQASVRPTALTIAGSDPSGGAGLQADLATFAVFGCHGAGVVTALTVQDTTGVHRIEPVPATLVAEQLAAVLADGPTGAVKTGMLATPATVEAIAHVLAQHPTVPLVVDPVAIATAGQSLGGDAVLTAIREQLLPRAALVTPNLVEAARLVGQPVDGRSAMRAAARALRAAGAAAAVVTGGHLPDRACDVLAHGDELLELDAPRVPGAPAHGTGCAFAAAVTACLALGLPVPDAVRRAKRFVTRALEAATARGRGLRVLDLGVATD